MRLKKNLDTKGRILRLTFAILLLLYSYLERSYLAFFGALFVFFEAAASWCIVYQIFGINSCSVSSSKNSKKK
jgi:hypothetical protein